MSVPRKNIKLNVNIDPPRIGTNYLQYGMERIEELMIKTDENTNYLPKTIGFEDIDYELFEYINIGNLDLVIDGKDVPTFYLENDRWGEFSKTWKYMDGDKNVPTPYITIRRINKERGTRMSKYRIPQPKTFRYLDVPILDEGQVINLRFKIPEPVNVDLVYEVRLFTKYRVDVNLYDEKIFRNFGSRQGYIWVKGSPMPVHLESTEEPKSIENIDGDRFFVSVYTLKVLGFIQNEEEFKIVKTVRRLKLGYDIDVSRELSNITLKAIPIKTNIIRSQIINNIINVVIPKASVSYHYDNITQMLQYIGNIQDRAIIFVQDASDDANITDGYAYYEFLGRNTDTLSDFRLLSSENALATLKLKTYTWLATLNQEIYTISGASENEIYQIDDFLVGGSKQLNNVTIDTVNVTNDTVVLNRGNNVISAGTEIYLEYLTKLI